MFLLIYKELLVQTAYFSNCGNEKRDLRDLACTMPL